MNLRSLGKAGRVSELGLGTAQLANADGSLPGVKPVPIEEARTILRTALERGVTFFDTADGYGCAEKLLGELPGSVKRGVIIATKAGLRDDGVRDFTAEYLSARLDRSLERLGVDCLELFQLNKPSAAELADGRLASFLAEQKKAGRIRRAGIVAGEPASVEGCLSSGVLDTVQVLHHLLYDGALDLMRRAAGLGLGVIVRSPLNSGLLAGGRRSFPAEDERSRYFSGPAFEARLTALDAVQRELGVEDAALYDFALSYVLSNPDVSTVIPGASRLGQLDRLLAAEEAPRFSSTELERIRAVVARHVSSLGQAFQLS